MIIITIVSQLIQIFTTHCSNSTFPFSALALLGGQEGHSAHTKLGVDLLVVTNLTGSLLIL